MPDEGSDPIRIVAALRARDVSFVLTGGLAAAARGSGVTTADVEVCVADDEANLLRLGLALEDLVATPAPSEHDDEHRVSFGSTAGRFAILEAPEGFEDLRARAEDTDLGRGVTARVAAVEDLVELARASGDLEAAAHLASFADGELDTPMVIEDARSDEPRRTERVWSALERVDTFLSDLDARGLKRHRDD
jgi:hypothetical protein